MNESLELMVLVSLLTPTDFLLLKANIIQGQIVYTEINTSFIYFIFPRFGVVQRYNQKK